MKTYLERFAWLQFKKKTTCIPIELSSRSSISNLKSEPLLERLIKLLVSVDANSNKFPHSFSRWLPYRLELKQSGIKGAGFGVYLWGEIDQGAIVAMYPGMVYEPGDPLFLSSIRNSYILRCFDGLYVDGKHYGLSAAVFKSMHRFHRGNGIIADNSWTKSSRNNKYRNPLAVGQIINNGTVDSPANVHYQELDLPKDFPLDLRKWIPNIHYSRDWTLDETTRIVLIISNKNIKNEELFSSYYEEVT